MRHHPCPRAAVNVSAEIRAQLLAGVCHSAYEKEEWEIAEEAINEWTRRHNPEALATIGYAGYQWKQLFLPTGTVLRTVFGGKNYHCTVDGDHILYQDKAVSPSGFVNAVGGIRRNAWRCTWILFPDTKHWALADTLRPHPRARPARPTAVKPVSAPQPGASEQAPPDSPPLRSARPRPDGGAPHGSASVERLAAMLQQDLQRVLASLADWHAMQACAPHGPIQATAGARAPTG
jgi:hypothetical protein